jgi:hypothetical protein
LTHTPSNKTLNTGEIGYYTIQLPTNLANLSLISVSVQEIGYMTNSLKIFASFNCTSARSYDYLVSNLGNGSYGLVVKLSSAEAGKTFTIATYSPNYTQSFIIAGSIGKFNLSLLFIIIVNPSDVLSLSDEISYGGYVSNESMIYFSFEVTGNLSNFAIFTTRYNDPITTYLKAESLPSAKR